MALSARELMLIVSAQNRASGALRRVARDVGGLRNMTALQRRAQQLRINDQVLRQQRQQAYYNEQAARRQLESIRTGKLAETQKLSTLRAELAASNVGQQIRRNEEARLRNAAQMIALEKQKPRLPHTQQIRDLRLEAARMQSATLAREEEILQRKADAATMAIKRQAMAVKDLAAREAEAGRMASYWASRQNVASLRLAKNAASMRDLQKAVTDARWDRVSRIGSAIQHTGRVAQYFGLVVGASLAYAAKKAADFSTETTLAATQVANKFHNTVGAAKDIQNGILKLMTSGRAFADSTKQNAAAYDIFSSMTLKGNQRQQIAQGMTLLGQFNRAAIAGQADLQDVTHAGITLLNNFSQQGKQVQQLPGILNRMFAAVRFGRMTVTEFVASLNQVAPAFSTAFGRTPQAFDQLSAAMATLTRQMPSVRMAATGLARLTEMFLRKDFVEGLKKSGVQITDVAGRLKPMNVIIDMLAKRFPQLKQGGQFLANFFKTITALGSGKAGTMGTIQGRRALQELILNQRQYHTLSHQVINDNNEFSKSFKAMSDTSGVKWKLFIQQIHGFVIEIGQNVIPMITQLGRPLLRMVDWFNKLDDGTKRTISRWAVWSVVGAAVAAVFTLIVGTGLRMFAMLGKVSGLFGALVISVGAVALAVGVLTGNWRSLNDVVGAFVRFGTGSLMGWVTMLGLAAGAALKFSFAMKRIGVAAGASNAAGAAGGLGGFLRGSRGFGRDLRAASQLGREVGGLRGLLTGAGLAAAAIPGPLWIAAGAIGAAAGAALLWKHHMNEVAKRAHEIAQENMALSRATGATSAATKAFGGLAGSVVDLIRAKNNLKDINRELKTAKGTARGNLLLDRGAALNDLAAATDKTNAQFGKFSYAIQKNRTELSALGRTGTRLTVLERLRTVLNQIAIEGPAKLHGIRDSLERDLGMPVGVFRDWGEINRRIDDTRRHFNTLLTSIHKNSNALRGAFTKNLQQFSRIGQLPGLSPNAIQDAFRLAMRKGRMLTLPELRAVIRAEVSPQSLAKARRDIRSVVGEGEKARMLAAGKASVVNVRPKIAPGVKNFLKFPFGKSAVQLLTTVRKPPNAHKVKAGVAAIFKKSIIQDVKFRQPTSAQAAAVSTGIAIANGIARGISAGTPGVEAAAVAAVDRAVAAAQSHAGIRSPSTVAAARIGKPFGQGIAMGLLQARGEIERAAVLTLDIMQGTFLQAREQTIKPLKDTQIKQLRINVDSAINRLSKIKGSSSTAIERLTAAEQRYSEALGKAHTKQSRLTSLHASLIAAQRRLKNSTGDIRVQLQRVALAQEKYNNGIKNRRLTTGDLTRDLAEQLRGFRQFNAAITRLRGRHVPSELLTELQGLGAEGAKKIALLASMSAPELRKYVGLWKKAQKEIKKSQQTVIDPAAIKNLTKEASQNLLDMYNSIHERNVSNFGELFAGPTDLSSMIGDSFQQAMDQYNQSVADYQKQIVDLNQQIADTQAQALAQAKDSFQQQFGQLFSGDVLQGAVATGFDQLFSDLQGQVDRFNKWRKLLISLAAKVPPELAKQLEQLGPEAVGNLEILNNATSDQLNQYVSLWQQGQTAINAAAMAQVAADQELAKTIADLATQIGSITDALAALSAPHPLGGADVIADVKAQLAAWQEYQGTLDALAKRGVPNELLSQLAAMGPQAEPYLKALVSLTDEQLNGKGGFVDTWKLGQAAITDATAKEMQRQLQMWYQHGANIAAAIIAGVASEQGALLAFFTNLFSNLLQGKFPQVTGVPGSTYTGPGSASAGQGGGNSIAGLDPAIALALQKNQGNQVNIQVNAHQSESLDSTLARTSFRMKNLP